MTIKGRAASNDRIANQENSETVGVTVGETIGEAVRVVVKVFSDTHIACCSNRLLGQTQIHLPIHVLCQDARKQYLALHGK
jgi:hypothetical protein